LDQKQPSAVCDNIGDVVGGNNSIDTGKDKDGTVELEAHGISETSYLLEGHESFSISFSSPHQRLPSLASSREYYVFQSDRKRRRSYRIQELQTKLFGKRYPHSFWRRCNIYIHFDVAYQFLHLDCGYVPPQSRRCQLKICGSLFLDFAIGVDLCPCDRLGVINPLPVTNLIGIVFGVILLVPILVVQGSNFLLLTCYRAFVYAVVSVFVAQTFGVDSMGRVSGSCVFIAALISLAQSPMAATTQSIFDENFDPINCFNLALSQSLQSKFIIDGKEDFEHVGFERRSHSFKNNNSFISYPLSSTEGVQCIIALS